jgi:hypothetical protein
LKRIVIPNEVRDLQFAVEENHASSGTLRTNSISRSILGGAALQRCGKTYPHPRTGRARLQPCYPEPMKKRALALRISADYPGNQSNGIVILSEAKDLLLPPIEENYASSDTLRNNSASHRFWVAQRFRAAVKALF